MSRAKRNGFANGAAAYRGTPSSFSATALFVGCVFFALCLPSPASAQTAKTHAAFTLSGDLDGAGAELGRITVDLAKEACDAGYCLTPEAIARLARKYFGTENPSLQVELVPQEGGKATPDGRFFDKPPVAKIRVTFAGLKAEEAKTVINNGLASVSLGKATQCELLAGNPVHIGTGNKYQTERQFQYRSPGRGYTFFLRYNSKLDDGGSFGHGWTHTFAVQGVFALGTGAAQIRRADGKRVEFVGENDGQTRAWQALDGSNSRLSFPDDESVVWSENGTRHRFDLAGHLIRIEDERGYGQTLAYFPAQEGQRRKLQSVTGDFGGTMTFDYDAKGRVTSLTDTADQVHRYGYDDKGNLSTVIRPDESVRRYLYEDTRHPHHLTGIIDGEGRRYLTVEYDDKGRGTKTFHGEGEDITDVTEITYPGDNRRIVNGREHVVDFINFQWTVLAVRGVKSKDGKGTEAGKSCSGVVKRTYYPDGKLATITDELGKVTSYTDYDILGRPGAVTEAPRTKYQRTTATKYHPVFSQPRRITRSAPTGKQVETFRFDTGGNRTGRTLTGRHPVGGYVTRTTNTLYDDLGRPVLIDGPQEGPQDTTRFTYYPNSENQGSKRGRLKSITNAVGQATQVLEYDGYGNILARTLANGLTEQLNYDARGQLIRRQLNTSDATNRTWHYSYDKSGLRLATVNPDGTESLNSYNSARKLTATSDHRGTKTSFSFDAHGNPVSTTITGKDGVLISKTVQTYDAMDRLQATENALGHTTRFGYDKAGRLISTTDPLERTTAQAYDPLGRVKDITNAANGLTALAYDVLDNRTKVTDPIGVPTAYVYDDLGNRLQEDSKDRGLLDYAFNAAGNVIAEVNALNQVTTYSYDANNRLVETRYGGTLKDAAPKKILRLDGNTLAIRTLTPPNIVPGDDIVRYTYAGEGPAAGQLLSIEENTGTIEYAYDGFGQLTTAAYRFADGPTLTQRHNYDAAGRRAATTLPGGQTLTYSYRAGDLNALYLDGKPVLSNIQYHATGNIRSAVSGNGLTYRASFDTAARLTRQTRATETIAYQYDKAGNITRQANETYNYDALDRLIGASNTPQGDIRYHYDANGNRTKLTADGTTTEYSTAPGTNRLFRRDDETIQYDTAGNRIEDARFTYRYNQRNRLSQVAGKRAEQMTRYAHNALGQRIRKTTDAGTTFYVYDNNGQLIAETDSSGKAVKQYLWLGTRPVAVLKNGELYFIHTDHLGTPRAVTDNNQTAVWQWQSTPFGMESPIEDGLVLNLRFPGQYFDQETGLHYNYFRDYEPAAGRYVESDPIGLDGGMNTVEYSKSNSLRFTDPIGLEAVIDWDAPDLPHLTPWGPPSSNIGSCGSTLTQRIIIPDIFNVVNFTGACNNHDKCYENCNGPDRKGCDGIFRQDLLTACQVLPAGSSVSSRCTKIADFYYKKVQERGSEAFKKARSCCPR